MAAIKQQDVGVFFTVTSQAGEVWGHLGYSGTEIKILREIKLHSEFHHAPNCEEIIPKASTILLFHFDSVHGI